MADEEKGEGELILYRTEDGREEIQLRLAEGSVWLTQAEIATLFETSKQNISYHIQEILTAGELPEEATVKDYLTVRTEGAREVRRKVKLFKLQMILAVGYRVRSPRGTQFRRWATTVLDEYLVKGFVINDQRLKQPGGWDYFDELLERIRDIRASERRFYQKVRDLFAETSVDYDPKSDTAQTFFATIQNKLVFAVTGKTAAELIVSRADPSKPNMGLTSWRGDKVRKGDVGTSKNYLLSDEIGELNLLTTSFLDFAELRARNRQQTTMTEWVAQTDRFLAFNEREVLRGAGRISHTDMEALTLERFRAFDKARKEAEKVAGDEQASEDLEKIEVEMQKLGPPKRQRSRKR